MNRGPDRRAVLTGRRARLNPVSSEAGLGIRAVKSLIYGRGPAFVGVEIVVADIDSILLLARAGRESGGRDVGLVDSFSHPVHQHLHHLSALEVFSAQNVQARALAGERASNNPPLNKLSPTPQGHPDLSRN